MIEEDTEGGRSRACAVDGYVIMVGCGSGRGGGRGGDEVMVET